MLGLTPELILSKDLNLKLNSYLLASSILPSTFLTFLIALSSSLTSPRFNLKKSLIMFSSTSGVDNSLILKTFKIVYFLGWMFYLKKSFTVPVRTCTFFSFSRL